MSNLLKNNIDPTAGLNTMLNSIFVSAPPLRIFILLISSVFIGYTLQPVPAWLSNMFDTSFIFKLLVLMFTGWASLSPLEGYASIYIMVFSFIILGMFELSRASVSVSVDVNKKK